LRNRCNWVERPPSRAAKTWQPTSVRCARRGRPRKRVEQIRTHRASSVARDATPNRGDATSSGGDEKAFRWRITSAPPAPSARLDRAPRSIFLQGPRGFPGGTFRSRR
jgi:hypothetical protein